MIEPRFYRQRMGRERFRSFVVGYKDSDLWIGVDCAHYHASIPEFAMEKLVELRKGLEHYILSHPGFAASFTPVDLLPGAPAIAFSMASAGKIAGTGPMAAVAGAFSEYLGHALLAEFDLDEIVIENGGDLFLSLKNDLILEVYAGKSVLTGKIGLKVPAKYSPLGICTSAGTVGPSVSFGKADAVMVACADTALADAWATAIGNRVKKPADIQIQLDCMDQHPEIISLLIICEENVGVRGCFELLPINGQANNNQKP